MNKTITKFDWRECLECIFGVGLAFMPGSLIAILINLIFAAYTIGSVVIGIVSSFLIGCLIGLLVYCMAYRQDIKDIEEKAMKALAAEESNYDHRYDDVLYDSIDPRLKS